MTDQLKWALMSHDHQLLKTFETYVEASEFLEKSIPTLKDQVFVLPLDECEL